MEFLFSTTCRRRSCCGSTRAGHPAGSFPCLRCGWRTKMGRAPAPPLWPPLPPPEGGAAGPGPGHLWRVTGTLWLCLCSSPAQPRTLGEQTTFIHSPLSVPRVLSVLVFNDFHQNRKQIFIFFFKKVGLRLCFSVFMPPPVHSNV